MANKKYMNENEQQKERGKDNVNNSCWTFMQLFGIYASGAYKKAWRERHLRENELKIYFKLNF